MVPNNAKNPLDADCLRRLRVDVYQGVIDRKLNLFGCVCKIDNKTVGVGVKEGRLRRYG